MTPWMRKLHKWVGLLIALQFVLWLASGLVMSLLDHDSVQGHEHKAHVAARNGAVVAGADVSGASTRQGYTAGAGARVVPVAS